MAFTTLPGASTADATSFIGTDGVDSIILTNVATRIWVLAQAAADRININISTQWGNYSLRGGQGNDTITLKGTTAESLVKADRDNDIIILASGLFVNTTINGNAGDDTIILGGISGFYNSTLFGGQGNDTINATKATVGVLMQGDAGNDHFSGGSGIDTFLVNAGDDTITTVGQGGSDVIKIARGASVLGTVAASWVATAAVSNQGNGTLISGAAGININLELASGPNGWLIQDSTGDEVLYGSALADTIYATAGNDELRGRDGDDSLSGGSGNDWIIGNEGHDWIDGGADDDSINAGKGNDTVFGGQGNDVIDGGSTGADVLDGGDGNDSIAGYSEADILTGGPGSDTFGIFESLFGVSGSSVIASSNTLTATGISDTDTITFATSIAGNVDRVTDFSIGIDKLDVDAASTLPTNLIGITTSSSLTLGTTYVAYGNYNAITGKFVMANSYTPATPDALVMIGNCSQTAITSTGYQVLTGLAGALTDGDFV